LKNKIAKPFEYMISQIQNYQKVDINKLLNNYEYEQIALFYESIRQLKIDLENENKQLHDENKDFILSSIHQLKTPLAAISMNLELIDMTKTKDTNIDELLDQIKVSVDQLNINAEELAYINLHQDIDYEVKPIIMSDVIYKRISVFSKIIASNNKKINIKVDKNIKITINELELERLIDNNISNAIKYSQANSTIYIVLESIEDKNILSISSQGKAIKNINKIFDKGYRESKDKNGYGLGLYIIKTICSKYNINIDISYDEDKNYNIFKYIF
jgi:K+-sensing histidine kinase KdpD